MSKTYKSATYNSRKFLFPKGHNSIIISAYKEVDSNPDDPYKETLAEVRISSDFMRLYFCTKKKAKESHKALDTLIDELLKLKKFILTNNLK